ncbi:MAG: aldolase/citrate lyase family protein [Chloroflexota bacterium]
MRENIIQKIWQSGGAVVNGWLHIPSSYSAEVMTHQGFDSLTIDLQHGPVHYDTAIPMLQAISTTDVVPLARVPWNEPGIIMKMLDVGCYGIICPMVNNRAECEAFVGACRYPPIGYRSNGPNRARLYAGDDYGVGSNDTVLALAMIETAEAMENLDEIMSVPGLSGVYVGPADLSISLKGGMPPDIYSDQVVDAHKEIIAAAKRHNIYPGVHCSSPQHATDMIEMGYRLVTLLSDAAFLAKEASNAVAEVRQTKLAQSSGGNLY